MKQIEMTEANPTYADGIWKFCQEILAFDAESENQFAGCMLPDSSTSAEEWIKI